MVNRAIGTILFSAIFLFLPKFYAAAAPASNQTASEIFFEPPDLLIPQISPDGTKVCALTRFDNIHFEITLIELSSMKRTVLARPAGMTAPYFLWKNDNLIFFLAKTDDGNRKFESIELQSGKIHLLSDFASYSELEMLDLLPDNPVEMLFRAHRINSEKNDLVRINVLTGADSVVERDPGGILSWFTNRFGETIAGYGLDTQTEIPFLLWRNGPKDPWQRRELSSNDVASLIPFAVAPDDRRLIVRDTRRGGLARVCYYDPINGNADEEIEAAHDTDPKGILEWGYQRETGAIDYPDERIPRHFINVEMEKGYAILEKIFPGTESRFISFPKGNGLAVVWAHSDRNAGGYGLINLSTGKFTVLGVTHRRINPARMAASRLFNFVTSDRLHVTGKITIPSGSEKSPAIVYLGPDLDNPVSTGGFYFYDQFFASQGFATIRINYRGTSGFGRKFATAGDFQLAGMGRDIEEGVKWLETKGWIDGNRVALWVTNFGSLIGFPLATGNSGFKALINFGSVIDTADFEPQTFCPSGRSRKSALELIGGKAAAEAFALQSSPLRAIPALSVPSRHFYKSSLGGTNTPDANKLKTALGKRKGDDEFFGDLADPLLIKHNITPWKEEARKFAEAVAFLKKQLHVADLPDAPTNPSP